jgi:hypothetical protein
MSNRIHLPDFELIPVLELDYSDFKSEARSYLESPTTEERLQFWLDSLADSGITGLLPIHPWSNCVRISTLPDAQLHSVLTAIIRQWGGMESLFEDGRCPALPGGVVLSCDEPSIEIEPRCCTSLDDVNSWCDALAYRDEDWKMMWIGHPWLLMKYENAQLLLAESGEAAHDQPPQTIWELSRETFAEQMAEVERELSYLESRLASILPGLGCSEDPTTTARQLVGRRSV